MTATLRPELIDLTLKSFFKNLLGQLNEVRLIINIDPIGDDNCSTDDILNICRRYCREIVHRCPRQPNFSSAVKWCWEQLETEYFLHLEDDWLLRRPATLQSAFDLFAADHEIASVRFNRSNNASGQPVPSPGFSLNPSIVRRKFVEEALRFFSCELDPEKQFCALEGEKEAALSHWKFVCYGVAHDAPYVIDLGRKWRKFMNFGKWRHDGGEITWQNRQMTRFRFVHYLQYKALLRYWKFL